MAKLEPYKHGYYLWQYLPSLAAAVIFAIFFAVATVLHFVKLVEWRARFCIPFAIGGIFEVIGCAAQAWAHFESGSIMPYSIQNVFLLLGPVLFAASVYMVLGRIIRSTGAEHHSLIPMRWLTRTFAINAQLGQDIVVAGLLIQVFMFVFFIITAMVFQIRLRRHPTPGAHDPRLHWRDHLHLLYGVSLLIMIRSLFRVAEFTMGSTGYPLTHEWTLYIFDALLMWLAMVAWLFWYPGLLSKPDMAMELLNQSNLDDE
ncbi:RTA1 domain-containing protein [Aspergillus brunneoviolaceus CBS 621.78]|uniref:RTA1-domain-containing protein n=1 Tax=Aspergillus brunneoviolaceus CBS 621.78 TaxID=1450534 RepID=A0ACD1GI84_9EURO|nr:RTA1-domain-containing protein [Aspergillus brunneoviolaceus CBS 621.78]RAH48892.1 RTA1-domain-containing protein [Aspergillus brunneoviolaceus CBS 621.78]